jgi:hypothetical protein
MTGCPEKLPEGMPDRPSPDSAERFAFKRFAFYILRGEYAIKN